ncbi:MAG: hypothetical protein HUJ26_13005 [Planctomycetaceae bacterium]|nr:hypothetical protein [Planctomycetaceae bacterium]
MKDFFETRFIETCDRNGNIHIIRAKRSVNIAFGKIQGYGNWIYKTVDGHSIKASTTDDSLMLYPGNIRLMPMKKNAEVAAK